jgi:putative nucleotidyltransferase with HDIG domain
MQKSIGLLTTYAGGAMRSYETAVTKAAREISQERGYRLVLYSGGLPAYPTGYEARRNFIHKLASTERVDGLFLLSAALSHFFTKEEFEDFCRLFEPLPMVSIGVTTPGAPGVVINNRQAMKELTLHLVKAHNINRPLFLGGPRLNREALDRLDGFRDALTEAGLVPDESMILEGTFHKESGYRMIREYRNNGGPPFDALISANDEMAVGARELLLERGLENPRDYLLTGFDDLEVSRLVIPSLTTIRQPVYAMARTACGLLCDRIEGRAAFDDLVYPTQLVLRDSCGCGSYSRLKKASTPLPETRAELKQRFLANLPVIKQEGQRFIDSGIDRFIDVLEELCGDDGDAPVLSVLHELLSGTEKLDLDMTLWQEIVLVLATSRLGQSTLPPYLMDEIRYRVCETEQLCVRRQRVMSERLESTLRMIGEDLINTFSVEHLRDILEKHLTGIPLKALQISVFERDPFTFETLQPLLRWDRIGGCVLQSDENPYPSRWLLPPRSPLDSGDPQVVEALTFREEVFGLLILVFDEPDGTICNSLREMLSGALKNITFWAESRERTRLLEILYKTEKTFTSWPEEETVHVELQKAVHGWLRNDYSAISYFSKETALLESRSVMRGGQFVPVTENLGLGPADGLTQPIRFEHEGVSGMRLPIRNGDRLTGVFDVGFNPDNSHRWSESVMRTLVMIVDQAVLALNSARLYRKTLKGTEQIKKLNEELALKLRRLTSLRAIDIAITDSPDEEALLGVLLNQIMEQLGTDAVSLLLWHPDKELLIHAGSLGFRTEALRFTRLRIGEGLAGKVALDKQLVLIGDFDRSQESLVQSPLLKQEGFQAYCAAPLLSRGELKGVLELFNRKPLEPDEEWREFLDVLTGQSAIALDHSELVKGLRQANSDLVNAWDSTIQGMSLALDLRDQETEGHSLRVTAMSEELARVVGLPDSELVHIHRGALLHDIGKMAIPDAILLKPGPLDEEEMAIMKKHPDLARGMLAAIEFLGPARDIPLYHHEKWDGTGYPRGLKGEEIPLVARIFALVDVWDALTSDRPYRKAWTEDKTAAHIRSLSGTHFDPSLTERFLSLRGY